MKGALFPGQGFQRFGMLAELATKAPAIVKSVVAECDARLPELELGRLLLGTGEATDVTPTELAQPLLLANSIAHFQAADGQFKLGMGHSLGEYTAFVAAGLLPLGDALQLLRGRGLAMKQAADIVGATNGMTLVMKPQKLGESEWKTYCDEAAQTAQCDVAAYNSPAAIVLSGRSVDLDKCVSELKSRVGRFVAKPLPVAGAFHSRHMRPAADQLHALVEKASWRPIEEARFPVVSNVTARPYSSLDEVRKCCVLGLTSPVRWCDSVRFAEPQTSGFESFGGDIGALMAKFLTRKPDS